MWLLAGFAWILKDIADIVQLFSEKFSGRAPKRRLGRFQGVQAAMIAINIRTLPTANHTNPSPRGMDVG